ncbi:MAG: hypothetical protein FIA82_02030 [Melioribacter sp.]|nr:hypothetical protein [Melioribacter sp.]
MKKSIKILFLFFILPAVILAQANGKDFGISFNLNYTTTSQLYLQPDSPDLILRGTHQSLDDIYSYSIDVRYQVSESIILGIGSESIKKTFDNSINLGGIRASMRDGYKMIPIEFSAYYLIPFSTERFKFYMGGGLGLYIGEQIRELGDVSISNESKKIGYGINVSIGMDFLVNQFLSIRTQMRFRDPEFEMESKYSDTTVNYNGKSYILPSEKFTTKVNIDGITFAIGAVINL